ncbi:MULTISPECIES: FUSC family protein [Streptomyces violaceusniger group]|uniref:Aromatic acid exporter family member 1 n=2 Tax=Streptomyces javensis TaxID=114698 RepID=A0ABN1WNS4_9ACTN|nr:aromatic acid exporter family protein [Streptomyces javensis]
MGGDQREPAGTGRGARIQQWWARAKGSPGHERHILDMIGKSTLAAALSWYVAHDLMAAASPAFAPFSAVLMIQVTVYQSLLQSLRYVGAVCAGVLVQAALGFLAGPDLVTFVLVVLIAMVIGRWRRLGEQGHQVVTAALFAFSTYVASSGDSQRLEQLGQIILLVAIGCAIGVLVNLTLFPPMRYRGAEEGIRNLAHALCDLIGDVYPALREGELEEERTRRWRARAAQTTSIVGQARSALDTAVEAKYYNPWRLLPSHRNRDFSGYRQVLEALERVTYQVASMTRTLDQWPGDETGADRDSFLHDYADLLEALGEITRQLSRIDERHLTEQSAELCRAAEAAQHKRTSLVENAQRTDLALSDPSRPYGILLAEALRLMEEAQHTCDVVQHTVDHAGDTHRTG